MQSRAPNVLCCEALERGFNLRWYVWTLSFASLAYSPMGRFADAVDRGERALAVAEEYDDASLVCFASWVLGFAHLARGDFARSLELGARAVNVAPTRQDLSWAGASHAWIQCRAGALEEEGIRVLEEAVVAHRAARSFTGEIWATALAESYLSVGRLDDARTTLNEVSAFFTANETAFYGGIADRLRGEVERAADRGPAGDEEARRSFERAIGPPRYRRRGRARGRPGGARPPRGRARRRGAGIGPARRGTRDPRAPRHGRRQRPRRASRTRPRSGPWPPRAG